MFGRRFVERRLGQFVDQVEQLLGDDRLQHEPGAELPRFVLEHVVRVGGQDDRVHVVRIAEQELQTVERAEADVGDQHVGVMGTEQAFAVFEGRSGEDFVTAAGDQPNQSRSGGVVIFDNEYPVRHGSVQQRVHQIRWAAAADCGARDPMVRLRDLSICERAKLALTVGHRCVRGTDAV